MPKKILVADDDHGYLTMMQKLLGERGFDVVTAADGEEAYRLAHSLKPDLILLDVDMPKMDGDELYMILKEKDAPTKDIPVLIVTGLRTEKDLEKSGDPDIIAKPVHIDQLLLKIKGMIGGV